jgi:2-methylcitrate dehydratase PrpD
VARGATVRTAAGAAKAASAIAHLLNTDRVMDRQYVSQATSTTANQSVTRHAVQSRHRQMADTPIATTTAGRLATFC